MQENLGSNFQNAGLAQVMRSRHSHPLTVPEGPRLTPFRVNPRAEPRGIRHYDAGEGRTSGVASVQCVFNASRGSRRPSRGSRRGVTMGVTRLPGASAETEAATVAAVAIASAAATASATASANTSAAASAVAAAAAASAVAAAIASTAASAAAAVAAAAVDAVYVSAVDFAVASLPPPPPTRQWIDRNSYIVPAPGP